MKKYVVSFILFITCTVWIHQLFAQNGDKIIIGSIDSIYSDILGEQRKIWVHVPKSDENTSLRKYNVLYLLDGEGNFYSVTGMIMQLSKTYDYTICPEMIVVGIPNTDRFRDLTPSHVGDSTNSSGGGEKFINFLEKELIPYVDNRYSTAPHRTLVGHSFGGLFVLNTLINHPAIFNNYVAIDPSLWWDNQKFLSKALNELKQEKYENRSLYISVANTMPAGMDTSKVKNDTSGITTHIRSILKLCNTLDSINSNGLNFTWKYYSDEDHSSVPIISVYDALHFIYSWMKFNEWEKVSGTESNYTGEELVDLIDSHYTKISRQIGYTILPDEQRINNLGYMFMNRKEYDKAYVFFNFNIKNYPQSANVYDSMGDYYLSQSNSEKAIEFFTKSIEIGGIPESKIKLDKLKAGKK